MVHIMSWRIALPSLRDVLPMFLETGSQLFRLRNARGGARRHCDVDRRQHLLVQAKRLARESPDALAVDRSTKSARCDRQT